MLSNARAESVERSAAETIIATTDLLNGLPSGHPARALHLRLLYKGVEAYETSKSLLTKGGDFHLAKKHCLSVTLQVVLPLGGATIKSLFVITGVDAAVTHVNKAVDFAKLHEQALYQSLFKQAIEEGKYPTRQALAVDDAMDADGGGEPALSSEKGTAWLLSFLKEKAESKDAISGAYATQLRLLHEFLELVAAQERADMPFDEEEAARFWLPIMKAAGKYHCAHSLAEKALAKLERSGYTRAAEQLLFTHNLSKFEAEVAAYCEENVHNVPSDWVNERLVDMTKEAVGGFSAMLPATADRHALSLQFYRHAREALFELCGAGGGGKDRSRAVPSAKLDDKLVMGEVLRVAGVWDGNCHRKQQHDPVALVHYLSLHEVPATQLIHAQFVYNEQFGLPEFAPQPTAAAAASAAASVAAAAPSHAADALISMASQGGSGSRLQNVPDAGRVLVVVGTQKLVAHARPPSVIACPAEGQTFSFATVIARWELTTLWSQQSSMVSLRTHHVHSQDTGGSLLTPLLQSLAKVAASAEAEVEAARGREATELLDRMLTQARVLSSCTAPAALLQLHRFSCAAPVAPL